MAIDGVHVLLGAEEATRAASSLRGTVGQMQQVASRIEYSIERLERLWEENQLIREGEDGESRNT